jgi:hypothetical protein
MVCTGHNYLKNQSGAHFKHMSAQTPASSHATKTSPAKTAEQSGATIRLTLKSPLNGRFMRADGSETTCRLWRISANNADLGQTGDEVTLQPDEHVIAYIENLGRIEGTVTGIQRADFTLQLQHSEHQKNKLITKINWLSQNISEEQPEQRRHARHTPARSEAVLTLSDGSQHACKILDLSLSGAAVETALRPPLRSIVTLGNSQAKVMRHFDEGIGIEFLVLQTELPRD